MTYNCAAGKLRARLPGPNLVSPMRRQLNARLFFWLVGSLVAAGLIVHVVHAVQTQRNAGVLLRHAEQALEKNDLDRAVTYLSHYLAYEPTDTDALAKYGIALDKHAQSAAGRIQAMLTMEEVLRREPNRADVRFRLVQCLIALGKDWLPQAIQNLDLLLHEWPDKAEVEHRLGWCYEASEAYARAAEWFKKAITHHPRRIPSYVLLAEVLQGKLDQRDEATAVMNAMVAANATSFEAYLARARFHKQRGALAAGEADVRRAMELEPKNDAVLLASAEWAGARGDLEGARKIVEQGLVLHPENEAMFLALAQLEARLGRRAEAIACLRRGLDAVPRSVYTLVFLADLLIDDGRCAEAEELKRRLRQDDPATPLADYLQARLDIAGRNWSAAAALLERARAELPANSPWNSQVEAALGLCYEQAGDIERQLAAYERAVELAPQWTAGRLGLAAALLSARRADEALAQLRIVQQAGDAPKSLWPLLVRTLVQRNLRQPRAERTWSGVADALANAARVTPSGPEITVLRAEVFSAQKNFAEAGALLRAARDKSPEHVSLWIALVNTEALQGNWSGALHILAEAPARAGDSLELRLASIAIWAARGGEPARSALRTLGGNIDAFSPTEQVRLFRVLGEAWQRLGDSRSAESVWRELARREPHDVRCRLDLFEIVLQQGLTAEAIGLADEIRRLDGDAGALTGYTQAALLLHEARNGNMAKTHEADRLLVDVARRRHTWPRASLLQAKSAELQGHTDRAIDCYIRALNLGEDRPALVQRLVRLLCNRRRYFEADLLLQKMDERMPLGKDMQRLAAEVALAVRDVTRAVKLAQEVVPPSTRDYRDLLWLARIAYLTGGNSLAEDTLRRAVTNAPHAPDTWIALVHHLARTDQRTAAQVVLHDMKHRLPADRLALTLARCEEALGHTNEADRLFTRIAHDQPHELAVLYHAAEFYQHADFPDKAEPLLRRLIDPTLAAPAEEVAWARRELAAILAQRGRSQEALKLLTDNVQAFGGSVADERSRAVVLGQVKTRVREAVALFESSLSRRPLTADEQFALVKLYDAAAEPAKARDWLQDLLTAHPDSPRYLAYFVGGLLKHGQPADAAPHLRRLEQLEPESRRLRQLKRELEQALSAT